MRLSLCVLLVALALCCYEANAKVCPAFTAEMRSFFLEPDVLYNARLLKFAGSREAREAKIKVKQWVGLLPRQDRKKIYNVLKSVVDVCNE